MDYPSIFTTKSWSNFPWFFKNFNPPITKGRGLTLWKDPLETLKTSIHVTKKNIWFVKQPILATRAAKRTLLKRININSNRSCRPLYVDMTNTYCSTWTSLASAHEELRLFVRLRVFVDQNSSSPLIWKQMYNKTDGYQTQ